MNKKILSMQVLPDRLAIVRLEPNNPVPAWVFDAPFFSITRTADELSLIVPVERTLDEWRAEIGWRALKVIGPLDFSSTGILAGLALPLAEAGISIFAVSTFDTDYLLVKDERLAQAVEVLTAQGHSFVAMA